MIFKEKEEEENLRRRSEVSSLIKTGFPKKLSNKHELEEVISD